VAANDLDSPLRARTHAGRNAGKRGAAGIAALAVAAFVAMFGFVAFWVFTKDDPLGGEPRHVVKLETPSQTPPAAAPQSQTKTMPAAPQAPSADNRTVTIIDGNTGQRRDVVVNNPAPDTPPANPNEVTAAAPRTDSRLVEPSKHGSIPKIGPDGVRPLEAYASPIPVPPAVSADAMIAIVITGLGISDAVTGEAIAKLPPAVTLSFLPHSGELPRWVTRARASGHEVLLQIPMEPFDYPDNDPGPQTLTLNATAAENIDRLHFFLSRVQGYVGVANFMGARFTSNDAALAAILAETGKRGLLFLDDGVSPRSVAAAVAAKAKAPFLRADLVIDAKPEWAEIDAALARLETLATSQGVVVATAGSRPVTLERLARWAKSLETRGIRLVPVSVAFQRKTKQS
jgi:polysaccharide deacetylase 2 family uncharacterized protein YibQ